MPDERVPGLLEAKVRADLEALTTSHPMGEALSEMALGLARRLDSECKLTPSMANAFKELRETLCELARLADGDDDGLSDALSVPTQMGDAAEP